MLVLTRKVDETIVVSAGELTITVLSVSGGKVRLGLSAPPEVQIHRQEVWLRIQKRRGEAQEKKPCIEC